MGTDASHPTTTIRLQGGEQIELSRERADRVFDELWLLAWQMKGAVSAAAKLKRVDAWTFLHGEDTLNAEETSALREAIRRLDAARP